MNITELSRKLRVSTKELKILLPEIGFDIGKKAIKVDDKVANQIIKDWKRLLAEYQAKLSLKQNTAQTETISTEEQKNQKPIVLPAKITVRELAEKLDIALNIIMRELMKNGILVSLNETIDFDTAAIIAEDLGKKVKKSEDEGEDTEIDKQQKLKEKLIAQTKTGKLKKRPPVIVVMGHVDHGKTKLLDAIRKTNVIEKESGGITQHIGAYQIEKNGEMLTFIDTPGHEAFTTMRTRGSRIADIAILVVAADDGVQPQTLEALRIIKNEHLPMIVVINKIDKPEANIEKVKKELGMHNIIPEEWGGNTIILPISAKTGEGLDALIDTLLLIAQTESDKLKTDWEHLPIGTIIESHMDKSEGTIATILVQAGILKTGHIICINNTLYGKIRVMKNYRNERIDEAPPGTPVEVLGLRAMPAVGDVIEIKESEKGLEKKIKTTSREQFTTPINKTHQDEKGEEDTPSLKLILKTDTLGSAEAIIESIAKINLPPRFKIDIIHKGLGNINETDVKQAQTTGGIVVGFNVTIPSSIKSIVAEEKIEVKLFEIIYELLNFLKEKILEMIKPSFKKKSVGTLLILKQFKKTKKGDIVGGRMIDGEAKPGVQFDIMREKRVIGSGTIKEIQSGKETVTSVKKGQECGLEIETLITPEPRDTLVLWENIQETIQL